MYTTRSAKESRDNSFSAINGKEIQKDANLVVNFNEDIIRNEDGTFVIVAPLIDTAGTEPEMNELQ